MALLRSKNGFSRRRRILLALFVVVLAGIGVLHFTGAAGISGMKVEDMDWNGDGTVPLEEILQSFYAVKVEKTSDGPRVCNAYAWRNGDTIRVDCRTELKPAE